MLQYLLYCSKFKYLNILTSLVDNLNMSDVMAVLPDNNTNYGNCIVLLLNVGEEHVRDNDSNSRRQICGD